jgi:hypothetical protein
MWPFRVSDATQKAVDEIVKKRNYINVKDEAEEAERKRAKEKQKRIDELAAMVKTMMEATPAIDFYQMRVVSIERVIKEITVDGHIFNIQTTIVGHVGYENKPDGIVEKKINEWMLHCSQEHHEKLVKDFNFFLAKRDSGELGSVGPY